MEVYTDEVYTENINKIALSCDDDKRIVTSLSMHFKELSYCVIIIDNNLTSD